MRLTPPVLLTLRLPLKDTDAVCKPLTAPDAVVETEVEPVPLGDLLGVPIEVGEGRKPVPLPLPLTLLTTLLDTVGVKEGL